MAKKPKPRRSECPLNATLESLGDHWSLLIVRDLMFFGRTSFKEFLEAGESIASNILADRLQKLETEGIVGKERDSHDARRYRYVLTEKGIDLAPILVEMILWGARHHDTAAPESELRSIRENREQYVAEIRKRWAASRRPSRQER